MTITSNSSQNFQHLHRTKEEYAYDTLRTAIMRCELAPGEKLVIDNLGAMLGVSPIPVRGALQRLQADGLVEITPHTGTIVSAISPDTVHEIFLLLEALENAAFGEAATRATAADIASLRRLIADMTTALDEDNAALWYDLNNRFHLAIAEMAGMSLLLRFTRRALDSRDRLRHYYSRSFITSRMADAHAEHCHMVDLLEARDTARLSQLVSQHNHKAKAAYLRLIEEQKTQ